MRIIVMGQAAFGAKVLEALLEREENVVAVYTPPDRPGGKEDPLKSAAIQSSIPVIQPASYKDPKVLEEFKRFSPDLLIMAYVTDIIPPAFFEVPSKGAICYHPSILPRHRGASAINWAVIMGDEETGLTIFWPDGGIDTGPILLQKKISIGPDDTTGSLYFNHLFPMGVEAILEAVELIKEGKAPRIPQDDRYATYEPICDDKMARIDWEKPAREVYNLIRGCDPQPGAFSMFKGEKVRFYGARLLREEPGKEPGTVIDISPEGIDVAVSGGVIRISKIRGNEGKLNGVEFAERSGLKVGDCFE